MYLHFLGRTSLNIFKLILGPFQAEALGQIAPCPFLYILHLWL